MSIDTIKSNSGVNLGCSVGVVFYSGCSLTPSNPLPCSTRLPKGKSESQLFERSSELGPDGRKGPPKSTPLLFVHSLTYCCYSSKRVSRGSPDVPNRFLKHVKPLSSVLGHPLHRKVTEFTVHYTNHKPIYSQF